MCNKCNKLSNFTYQNSQKWERKKSTSLLVHGLHFNFQFLAHFNILNCFRASVGSITENVNSNYFTLLLYLEGKFWSSFWINPWTSVLLSVMNLWSFYWRCCFSHSCPLLTWSQDRTEVELLKQLQKFFSKSQVPKILFHNVGYIFIHRYTQLFIQSKGINTTETKLVF